ncbi:DUF3987 domain-containing protein [Methylobacterium brachiatum]|uniref:DUF3987 domain-containing protein n=1 Tax=Methylobacterium brachiatum TaxID=269660 RepID=A0ABV1R5C1_9HYPH
MALIGSGLIAVAAIDPEAGGCHGATFALPSQCEALNRWIEARQGKYNLYFTLNEPVPPEEQQGKNGRVCKADIARIRGVAIDCDPVFDPNAEDGGLTKERERLFAQAVEWRKRDAASAAIDSGGGYQGVWLLRDPLPATPEIVAAVEAQARGLAHLNNGDNTHDVSHLFRLPGTLNLPNAKKRARKRVPAAVQGKVFDDPRRLHTLKDLAILAPPILTRQAAEARRDFDLAAAWEALRDPAKLGPGLTARLTAARAVRPSLDKCLSEENTIQCDRSKRDFAVAAAVIRAGFLEPPEIAAIVAAYSPEKFEAEAEARGDGRAEYYLRRTAANALAQIKPDAQSVVCAKPEAQPSDFFETIEDVATESAEVIGEPVDLFGEDDPADLSAPPPDSLPEVVEAFARTIAIQMGVPESFAAITTVAALAGAIGNALRLQVNQHSADFRVPASLAVVIVARPGRKKSPTIDTVLAPHRALDRELHAASSQARSAWRAAHCTPKGSPKAGAPPPPPERQILVDDATLEKQVRIHADNPAGIIRAPDELLAFLGNMGAYKRSSEGDRGTILKMLDGSAVKMDRVSGTVRADSALMGLIASTQPDKIRTLTRDLGSDGFLQRLIFITDDGLDRLPQDVPVDRGAVAEYERAVRAMFALRSNSCGVVQLSPEARAILSQIWSRVRALGRLPGASEAWAGHISKWEGMTYRIALTFHALDSWACTGGVPTGSGTDVTATTARRASRFITFLVRHALRFYGEFYEPSEHTAEAREVAGYLLTRPDILSVTARDIEKVRRPLAGKRSLTQAAMRELEHLGWITVAERGAEGPSKWTVNPRIHERFAAHAEREKVQRAQAQAQIAAALSAKQGLRDA